MDNELKKVTKSLVEAVQSVLNEAKQEFPIGALVYLKNKKTYGTEYDKKYHATPFHGIVKKRNEDGEHLHIDAGYYPHPNFGGYGRTLMLKIHKNDISKNVKDSWFHKEKDNNK